MTPIRSIAVGFDGSPHARKALAWAADVGQRIGAEVAVVHAVGLLEHASDAPDSAAFEDAARSEAAQRGLDPKRVQWCPVDGDACSALIRSVDPPIGADLLVVGTRGRGGHSGLLLGSTSLELAEHAPVPVVVVPLGDPPDPSAVRAKARSRARQPLRAVSGSQRHLAISGGSSPCSRP